MRNILSVCLPNVCRWFKQRKVKVTISAVEKLILYIFDSSSIPHFLLIQRPFYLSILLCSSNGRIGDILSSESPTVINFHPTYLLFTVLTPQKHNKFLIPFTHWKISLSVTLCLALLFSAKSSVQSSHTLPVYRPLQTQRALIVFMIQLFNRNKCRPCKEGCVVKGDCKHTINLLSHAVSLKGCPVECLGGNHNKKWYHSV